MRLTPTPQRGTRGTTSTRTMARAIPALIAAALCSEVNPLAPPLPGPFLSNLRLQLSGAFALKGAFDGRGKLVGQASGILGAAWLIEVLVGKGIVVRRDIPRMMPAADLRQFSPRTERLDRKWVETAVRGVVQPPQRYLCYHNFRHARLLQSEYVRCAAAAHSALRPWLSSYRGNTKVQGGTRQDSRASA